MADKSQTDDTGRGGFGVIIGIKTVILFDKPPRSDNTSLASIKRFHSWRFIATTVASSKHSRYHTSSVSSPRNTAQFVAIVIIHVCGRRNRKSCARVPASVMDFSTHTPQVVPQALHYVQQHRVHLDKHGAGTLGEEAAEW